jgi:polyisoprenoid-binding protein YceI
MTIDRRRSTVGFLIRHMGVATVRGTFASFTADVQETPAGLRVHGEVDAASVDTGEAVRDGRLRDEFFDAPEFPVIAFEGLAVAESGVSGFLTIRGVTRAVRLELSAEPLDDGEVHLRAEGRIRRSEFGLDWEALRQAGRLLVADHVRLFADVVVRPGAPGSRPAAA